MRHTKSSEHPSMSSRLPPEGLGAAMELVARLGFGTSALLALFLGRVLLAAVLGGVALGMFLRVWRLRSRRRP